ncbi:uncharacterized protein LOC141898570 isoform X2 [Tubulanus polymorphus]|uniref:uncharacterized protein LOC141898570 isoform X2 n=1 Tax=Tubulanus polymorphus TaxID=672921 RepID=UPI003DA26E5F
MDRSGRSRRSVIESSTSDNHDDVNLIPTKRLKNKGNNGQTNSNNDDSNIDELLESFGFYEPHICQEEKENLLKTLRESKDVEQEKAKGENSVDFDEIPINENEQTQGLNLEDRITDDDDDDEGDVTVIRELNNSQINDFPWTNNTDASKQSEGSQNDEVDVEIDETDQNEDNIYSTDSVSHSSKRRRLSSEQAPQLKRGRNENVKVEKRYRPIFSFEEWSDDDSSKSPQPKQLKRVYKRNTCNEFSYFTPKGACPRKQSLRVYKHILNYHRHLFEYQSRLRSRISWEGIESIKPGPHIPGTLDVYQRGETAQSDTDSDAEEGKDLGPEFSCLPSQISEKKRKIKRASSLKIPEEKRFEIAKQMGRIGMDSSRAESPDLDFQANTKQRLLTEEKEIDFKESETWELPLNQRIAQLPQRRQSVNNRATTDNMWLSPSSSENKPQITTCRGRGKRSSNNQSSDDGIRRNPVRLSRKKKPLVDDIYDFESNIEEDRITPPMKDNRLKNIEPEVIPPELLQDEMVTCPICYDEYPHSEITHHASGCEGTSDSLPSIHQWHHPRKNPLREVREKKSSEVGTQGGKPEASIGTRPQETDEDMFG